MILDSHIHISSERKPDPAELLSRLQAVGIAGGVVLSLNPLKFRNLGASRRLANLFAWTANHPLLYPFYRINPLDSDAEDQVALAMKRGVAGFKIICSHFFPSDPRCLKIVRLLATLNRPVLFHSGILWDGHDSSRYNRPAEFEVFLDVPNLKFTLAHLAWPWCDEAIAVYGKFLNARAERPDTSTELFLDITPGTPAIYRREALTKLFLTGYDVSHHVLFGTDCSADNYNQTWAAEWMDRDNAIYRDIGVADMIHDQLYHRNLLRFLGKSQETVVLNLPKTAE
ncbi:MAG: amidohydrolase family protein [Kiritimatiellae bacterium]|nr:amidohydrolase family protein [Kiritimatiellia bacterium]